MKFLAVIFVVLAYRNWLGGNPIRDVIFSDQWFQALRDSVASDNLRYGVAVVLPALLLFWLTLVIDSWLFGLVYLALCLAVLLFAIEIVDLDVVIDDHRIRLSNQGESDETFVGKVTYKFFKSIVPAVFWFLMLGPVGALVYALTDRYQGQLGDDESDYSPVGEILYWMEWIPARVTGLIFAFLGEFRRGFAAFLDTLSDTENSHALILSNVLRDSIVVEGDDETQLLELQWLLENTVWGWVAIAAVLTIMGW